MANVVHRNRGTSLPARVTLAAADDLDGTTASSVTLKIRRGDRALIVQMSNGTLGTAGVDCIEISVAGGAYIADPTLVLASDPDQAGTYVTSSVLNVAGVEPVTPSNGAAIWKIGPYARSVTVRCARLTGTGGGTTWVTGAPSVYAFPIKNKR
jgi:hypothetical protein